MVSGFEQKDSGNEIIIGIDLGTTNSEVAVVIDGQPRIISEDGSGILPSVVGLDQHGALLVGVPAVNQSLVAPERTARRIKRKMGPDEKERLGDGVNDALRVLRKRHVDAGSTLDLAHFA